MITKIKIKITITENVLKMYQLINLSEKTLTFFKQMVCKNGK